MYCYGSDEVISMFMDMEKPNGVRLNHGSFGLAPARVLKAKFQLLKEQEEQPDLWFRKNALKYYINAVTTAAKLIDADVDDTVLVDNTTTGINCVLKSLKFDADDEILLTTHTYPAVENTAKEVESLDGCKRTYIRLTFPITNEDQIVDMYKKKLKENSKIKIAVIDHITCPSALLMPVKKIVKLCKRYNVLTVIDGAHAPGQIKLSMKELDADFYCGSFYKWMYTARSCGFLWISPSFQGKIIPVITSYFTSGFHLRFAYLGTRDTSQFFTLPAAVEFYEEAGGLKAITAYADDLLTWAQKLLCDALGTKPLAIPRALRAPCMAVVGLPQWPKEKETVSGQDFTVQFWEEYSVQVNFLEFNNRMWLRICANIYNTKEDYIKLTECLLDFYGLDKACTLKL